MISKERLDELIEQGATIYEVKYNNINSVSLTNKIRFVSGKHKVIVFEPRPDEKYLHYKYFKNLFETKEEAEWHKEFGCIKRTEKLELPTWEEIKHDFIYNKQSDGNYCVVEFFGFQEYSLDIVVYNGDAMITISDEYFYNPLTKENYTLACRKAKELFLKGENNENN